MVATIFFFFFFFSLSNFNVTVISYVINRDIFGNFSVELYFRVYIFNFELVFANKEQAIEPLIQSTVFISRGEIPI